MDLYNINSAISQGNALTQSTDLYNETINKARDDVKNYYTDRLRKDDSQQDEDDYIYGAQDLISSIQTGLASQGFKDAYKDFDESENVGEFFSKQFERGREANPLFYKLGGLASTGAGKATGVLREGAGAVGGGALALGGRIRDGISDALDFDPARMADRDLAYERSIRGPSLVGNPNPPPAVAPAPTPAPPTGAEGQADPRVSRSLNANANGADAGDGNGAPVRPSEAPVAPANDLEGRTIRVAEAPQGGLIARRQRRIQQQLQQARPTEAPSPAPSPAPAPAPVQEPEPAPEALPSAGPAPVEEAPLPPLPPSVRGNEIDFKLNSAGSRLVQTDEFGNQYRHLDHVGNVNFSPELNDPDTFADKLDSFGNSQFKKNNPNSQLRRFFDPDTGFVQDRVYLDQPSAEQSEQLGEVTLSDLRQRQSQGLIPQRPADVPDQPQPTNVGVQDTSAGSGVSSAPLTDLQRQDFRDAQIAGTIEPDKVPAEARMSPAELQEARGQSGINIATTGAPPPPPAGPPPVTGRGGIRARARPAVAPEQPRTVSTIAGPRPAPAPPPAPAPTTVSTIAGPREGPLVAGQAPPRPEPSTISTIAGPRPAPLQSGPVPQSGEAPSVRPSEAPSVPAPNIPEEGGQKTLFQQLKEFKETPAVKTAGKLAGNIQGGLDIYDYFSQGEKWKTDNSAETWGDRLTALGTVLDVVGTVNPLLETVGAVSSFAGSIATTIGEHEADVKKTTVTDPNNESQELSQLQTKVAPSFQQLGQIASQNNHVSAMSGYGSF